MTDMSVDQLLEAEGLDANEVLGWARLRADELLAELPEGSDLGELLAGLAVATPRERPQPEERLLGRNEPDSAEAQVAPQQQMPHTTEEMELDEVELIDDDELELLDAGDGDEHGLEDPVEERAAGADDEDEDTNVSAIPQAAPQEAQEPGSGVPELVGSGEKGSISEALEISEEIDLSDLDDL